MKKQTNSASDLLPMVYDRLRKFAASRLAANDSLFGTNLVHEGYLRIAQSGNWESPSHLYRGIRNAMKNVIVDHLRKRNSLKRGGNRCHISLDIVEPGKKADLPAIVRLGEALDELAKHDNRAADVVTLRFFACMTEQEVADQLHVSRRTVSRDWIYAKTWLRREMA